MTADVRSRSAAFVDVALIVGIGFGLRGVLRLLGTGVIGGSLSILVLWALATRLLARRGTSWRELGFRRPADAGAAAAWALGLLAVDVLVIPQLTAAAGSAFGWPSLQLAAFARLRGNLPLYLLLLIPISWGTAAFGEELIFRGFLARRLAEALGATRPAESLANVVQALLFALGHAYLGPRGMLNAGLLGFAAGLASRLAGRNLWPVIIAHGFVDSIGITALYLGASPH
jgi:hypothetical protein